MIHASFPAWLRIVSSLSIASAVACAVLIVVGEITRPQKMWIMNLVWPLSALFGSLFWLIAYFAWGRRRIGRDPHQKSPFPVAVLKASSHCGAGCTLGDLIAEWLAFAFPTIAVWFGWRSLFAEKTFAVWGLDFILAFAFGIAFQYFTIKPMRDISAGQGLIAALKADAASIAAWQVGMYGMMALLQFGWFRPAFGAIAPVASAEFWFAMQLAMLAGFATAYPVNWLLIRKGLKEEM